MVRSSRSRRKGRSCGDNVSLKGEKGGSIEGKANDGCWRLHQVDWIFVCDPTTPRWFAGVAPRTGWTLA